MQHNSEIIDGPAVEVFDVQKPIYCPFYSINNGPAGNSGKIYHFLCSFELNPFTIHAQAASGSPVLIDWSGRFFGFLKNTSIENSTFAFDAETNQLTITVPEGQSLYVAADTDTYGHWRAYNSSVMEHTGYAPITDPPDFWTSVEYCTWVEQKYRGPALEVLNHDMVMHYVDKLDAFGYPKGKVTIDHGWAVDPAKTGFGDWTVDKKKFPSLEKTAAGILERGHVPGLWFGLPRIHPRSELARAFPEFLGDPQTFPWQEAEEGTADTDPSDRMHFLNCDAPLSDFLSDLFATYHAMGFRKFKIDMSYHNKAQMIRLHEKIYSAAKDVDRDIEMEFHIPDIFAARFADTIRTNDVWCMPYKPWYELTAERYRTCYHSAPGRLLNRDHIGGNNANVRTADFLAHLATYSNGVGYPSASLLPHHFGRQVIDALGQHLWDYDSKRQAISDFHIRSIPQPSTISPGS